MGEYECERNAELPPDEVEAVLGMARACLLKEHDGITILDRREASLEFRRYAGIKAKHIIECIKQLEVRDYSTTSYKPNHYDAHVFGTEIKGYDVYLKFQIVEDTLIVRVISIHPPDRPTRYAYRT